MPPRDRKRKARVQNVTILLLRHLFKIIIGTLFIDRLYSAITHTPLFVLIQHVLLILNVGERNQNQRYLHFYVWVHFWPLTSFYFLVRLEGQWFETVAKLLPDQGEVTTYVASIVCVLFVCASNCYHLNYILLIFYPFCRTSGHSFTSHFLRWAYSR